jgi:hypothetical protein
MIDLFGIITMVFGYMAYRLSEGREVWLFVTGMGAGIISGVYYMVLHHRTKLFFLVILSALNKGDD